MALSYLKNHLLVVYLLFVGTITAISSLNVSGDAYTARFWDCCKPSCSWQFKADVSNPVQACNKDGSAAMMNAGSGCGDGGTSYQCSGQQPWAINSTLSYGFGAAYILASLVGDKLENTWCCACYRLDFTSEPLKGKSMIIQASNTAYETTTSNYFALAIPGGNTSDTSPCHTQYGVQQSVFGQTNTGVKSKGDCQNLPEPLRAGCEWRFDWWQDALYPTAKFQRVACPKELTDKTQCIRKDEAQLGQATSSNSTTTKPASAAINLAPALSLGLMVASFAGLWSM